MANSVPRRWVLVATARSTPGESRGHLAHEKAASTVFAKDPGAREPGRSSEESDPPCSARIVEERN